MPEVRSVDRETVRTLAPANYVNGQAYFKKGAVNGTWRSSETVSAGTRRSVF